MTGFNSTSIISSSRTPVRSGIIKLLSLARSFWHQIPLPHETKLSCIRTGYSTLNAILFVFSNINEVLHSILAPFRLSYYRLVGYPGKPQYGAEQIEKILKSITFTSTAKNVKISIIIPCFNKLEYTAACLASIAKYPPSHSFEIIIVDDASSKDLSILSEVPGIKFIRNEKNLGYIKSCNIGASHSRGEYLYLLNNDTIVLENSIDALFRTFQLLPKTGLAGSKLIYPDSQLQEAGAIVWKDGSAWNYGRLKPPNKPEFNYLRPTDYCSAASVLVRKQLFLELGGFDEAYIPAYYEDTDLAFRIREKGHDVIYQPDSIVVHYEGTSNGLQNNGGLKSYQYQNRNVFAQKWANRLASHRPAGVQAQEEKDRYLEKRVLFVDHFTPNPDRDAGSVVLLNLMILLRGMGYQPTFIPELNPFSRSHYTKLCQSLGIECLYSPYFLSTEAHLRKSGDRYDLIILFRPDIASKYMDLAKQTCGKAKIFYYPHDLHYLRLERQYNQTRNNIHLHRSQKSRVIELMNSRKADATIVLSPEEELLLRKELPHTSIEVLPLIMSDPKKVGACPLQQNIVFIGNFSHEPNVDAALWFANEIFPLISPRVQEVHFYIVGQNPPENIKKLSSRNISVCEHISDLEHFLQSIKVSVVPLRFGAGLKGKIGSALRGGVPVVSTDVGVEGMPVSSGDHLIVASSAGDFADAVVNILCNQKIWQTLRDGGLRFAKEEWGQEASFKRLKLILAKNGLTVSPEYNHERFRLYPF